MTPADVLRKAYDAGLEVGVAPSGNLAVKPADRLTPELRGLLIAHKSALLQALHEAEQTTAEVLEAAMKACDRYGDDAEAREEMRRDVLGTPPHLKADLLAHFQRNNGGGP